MVVKSVAYFRPIIPYIFASSAKVSESFEANRTEEASNGILQDILSQLSRD
jgi:hypothetical protein